MVSETPFIQPTPFSGLDITIPRSFFSETKLRAAYILKSIVFLLVPDGILKNPALKKGFIR